MALPPNASASFPSGAGPAPAPTVEDFAPAVDAQAQAIDGSIQKVIPPANRYTGATLRVFAAAVMKACGLLDGQTYEVPKVMGADDPPRQPVQIPLDLAKHYFAMWQAWEGFSKLHPDDAADLRPVPPLETLVDDGEVALAANALAQLSKSKEFKAFLKESPEAPAEQATDTGPEQGSELAESPHAQDLATLFGGGQ